MKLAIVSGSSFNVGSARLRWAIPFSSPVGFQGPLVPPVVQVKPRSPRRQQPPM